MEICDRKYCLFGEKSTFGSSWIGYNTDYSVGHNMPKKSQQAKNIVLYI